MQNTIYAKCLYVKATASLLKFCARALTKWYGLDGSAKVYVLLGNLALPKD
jgi:hypothetical protein